VFYHARRDEQSEMELPVVKVQETVTEKLCRISPAEWDTCGPSRHAMSVLRSARGRRAAYVSGRNNSSWA
jgi:hypothetical protein